MMRHRCDASSWGRRSAITVCLATLSVTGARATELKLPAAKPAVVFDVPDGWTIDKSGKSLDVRSPEKNAIIIAEVISKDKATLDAWSRQASTKLKSFGVAFDEQAVPPPKPPTPPVDDESAFTKSPDKFTFSGQPSLATPGTAASNDPVKPGKTSMEALTGRGPDMKPLPVDPQSEQNKPVQQMPKLPFRAVQYYGTTMNRSPVDVQLVIYPLPDKRAFVMMQESGPEDGRAVAIAASVRSAKEARGKTSGD